MTASTNLGCWTSSLCLAVSMKCAMRRREFALLQSNLFQDLATSRDVANRLQTLDDLRHPVRSPVTMP